MSNESNFQLVEEWITPGVCLLARSEVKNRGLLRLANHFMSQSGLWAYVHETEAILVDAPFACEDAGQIIQHINEFLRTHNVKLKFITSSHLHIDHSAGLSCLLDSFNAASFVYPVRWKKHLESHTFDNIAKCVKQAELKHQWNRERHQSYDKLLTVDLAGEPLHLIEAPYHSPTDQLAIFRGFTLLPDWHLPTHLDESLQLVNATASDIRSTIVRLREFERETGYRIDKSCAVHANEPLRFDFQERLDVAYRKFVM